MKASRSRRDRALDVLSNHDLDMAAKARAILPDVRASRDELDDILRKDLDPTVREQAESVFEVARWVLGVLEETIEAIPVQPRRTRSVGGMRAKIHSKRRQGRRRSHALI